ncbi:MAG: hypothetical protein HQM06_11780 [Magnetococcales bacterium]|nr:hypothetical protein [Magnetococcales bacterium]
MDYYGQQTASTFQQEAVAFLATPPGMVDHSLEASTVHPLSETATTAHPVAPAADPFMLLEAKMESMRQAILAWKSRAELLQSTLHEREALAAAQQEQIIALQEQMAQLQVALQDQQEQTNTLSQTLSDEESKSALLAEQGAGYLLQINEKEQQIAENEAKILTLEQLAIRFEVQMQHMHNEQLQLENNLTAKEKSIADLEGYITLVEQENGALKQQLEQFSGVNSGMLNRLNSMLDRFAAENDSLAFPLPNSNEQLGIYGDAAGHA